MATQKEVFLQKLLNEAQTACQLLLDSEAAFEAEAASDDLDSYTGPCSVDLHSKAVKQAELVIGQAAALRQLSANIEAFCQTPDYRNWESSHKRN